MDNKKWMLGARIRARRRELGLTQAQLAAKLYISNKAVSKWETGEANPDITLFPRLAEVLGMSTDELLGVSVEKAAPADEPKPTAGERIQYVALACLAVVLGLLSALFFGSGLLAFDASVVSSSTGDASAQPFLILFSMLVSLLVFSAFWPVAKRLRRLHHLQTGARLQALRARCAQTGCRAFVDLPKEEQKQLVRAFRKAARPLFLLSYLCLGAALVAVCVLRPLHVAAGQIVYTLSVAGFLATKALLLRRRRSFFLEKGVYDMR